MSIDDALVVALLVLADVVLMVYLRRRRGRRLREERAMRSLQFAIRREAAQAFVLRRSSGCPIAQG
ncbi:MAG: hypothetical protein LAQ69_15830 [Acidobacteriia bacterium]|nr:hypothetical protein [Terriglobia bacterium]